MSDNILQVFGYFFPCGVGYSLLESMQDTFFHPDSASHDLVTRISPYLFYISRKCSKILDFHIAYTAKPTSITAKHPMEALVPLATSSSQWKKKGICW